MTSPKRLARKSPGVLYLFVDITGGFAEGFVEPKVYVAGDAAATTTSCCRERRTRACLGVVSDLLERDTVRSFLAMTLYVLLQHVHQSVARTMVVICRTLQPTSRA